MKYGTIPGIDKPVSRIVQGSMMISSREKDKTYKLLDEVFEQGINTFDHAHIYGGGDCERVFGQWVADRKLRDKVVLLDKGAHHNADRRRVTPWDISADIHDSLARTRFDYIDLYVLHRDDPSVPVGPIVEVLNEHRRAGKILAFGGSNWSHERVRAANEYAKAHGLTPFVVTSPQFSLCEMVEEPWPECVSISGPGGAAARQWYAQSGVTVFAWSSLGRGFLSGKFDRSSMAARPADDQDIPVRCFRNEPNLKRLDRVIELAAEKGVTVAQIAVAWLMNHPLNIHALIGVYSGLEAQANVAAMEMKLTAAEMSWLDLQTDAR